MVWSFLSVLSVSCGGDDSPGFSVQLDSAVVAADAGVEAGPALPGLADAALNSDGASSTGNACAWADARPVARATAIWLVMDQPFLDDAYRLPDGSEQGDNRAAVRTLLFGGNGIVTRLQSSVSFGLAHHDIRGTCPDGVLEPAALNNANKLAAAYDEYLKFLPSELAVSAGYASLTQIDALIAKQTTPTHNSVVYLRGNIDAMTCRNFLGVGQPAEPQVRAAAEHLAQGGTSVSVVTFLVADVTSGSAEEANRALRMRDGALAAAGKGESFAGTDGPALGAAIERIIAQNVSCEIALNGKVRDGEACRGEVALNDAPVPCNQPDGYRLKDPSTIELTGKACNQLRADVNTKISARFPCEVFVELK